MGLFQFIIPQYMVQVIFYSLVAAVVVEALIKAWKVERPLSRLRFRLVALILPVVALPVYQLAYPARSQASFRRELALLDLNQWLSVKLWLGVPLGTVLLLVMGLATALFLFYEGLPLIKRTLYRRKIHHQLSQPEIPRLTQALKQVADCFGHPAPEVYLLDDTQPVVYVSGPLREMMVVSPGLVELLDEQELEGVLAHEMAHIARKDVWVSWAWLFFRAMMFFNPVALVVIRRIVHENEKVCDDMAVAVTGDSLAFAASIIKLFRASAKRKGRPASSSVTAWFLSLADALQHQGSKVLVQDRVERVIAAAQSPAPLLWEPMKLTLTVASLGLVLFFVV